MMASSGIMGTAGFVLTFLPEEILHLLEMAPANLNVLFLQIMGALYLAFAMLNWMARANLIGGIYSKPVAVGNFAHFFIAGITIIKNALASPGIPSLWVAGIIYALFAVLFARVAFGDPLKLKKN